MRRLLALLLAGLLVAGCVPASPDADTYDDKASRTLGSAVSEVRTVEKVLRTLYDDRMHRQTAITQLRYSEKAIDTAATAFTELNPPPERDRLTTRVDTRLGNAQDLLDETRTAIERYRREDYPALVDDLETLARQLERLEGRVS